MKIILLPGSRRQDSINVRLLMCVEKKLQTLGIETDLVGSSDLQSPIYDGDCEAKVGVPDSIKDLNRRMLAANALIVASPEYNGFFSPLLKNTLDWMSRSQDDQPGAAVFRDKAALALAASPGPMAAARALPHIRTQLSNLGLNVYRSQLGVGRAGTVLSDNGDMLDGKMDQQLNELVQNFTEFVQKLM